MPDAAKRTLPTNFIAQAGRGLTYPLEALGFISRHGLWGLTVVAIAANVVLLFVLGFLTWYFAAPWLDGLDAWLLGSVESDFMRGVMGFISGLLFILAILLAVAANALAILLIGQAVASPFLDMLSEKVEHLVLGTPEYPFSTGRAIKSVVLALSDLVWTIIFLVAINLPIWLVGMLFPPAAAVASFAFTALVLAHEFVSFPLARHLVSYRRRWRAVWTNKWLSFGFGTGAMVLLLVPGINLVLLPLAAVGGTLMYCDLKSADRLGDAQPTGQSEPIS